MRLDHHTGRVVFCKSLAAAKWQCDPVPEEEGVLLAQLKQAESDNGKLTEQLGELQKHLGMPAEERAALKAAIEKSLAGSAAARSELGSLREEIASLTQPLSSTQPGEALKADDAMNGVFHKNHSNGVMVSGVSPRCSLSQLAISSA